MEAIPLLLTHIYWELVVGIVFAGMILSNLFKSEAIQLHKKWIVFGLGLLGSVVYYFFHERVEPFSIWKAITSLGVATVFYDYIVKCITDVSKGKNPFKDHNP